MMMGKNFAEASGSARFSGGGRVGGGRGASCRDLVDEVGHLFQC